MKGVFYGRHSTNKQEMLSQESACDEFVKKNELILVDKYFDPAVSARNKSIDERPDLKRMLDDAKQKAFDFVLVWSEDRLARKTREHREIRKLFQKYQIPVYVLHNQTRYDIGDLLAQTIRDSFSQYQGDKIAGDTRRAMKTLIREGKWAGGNVPYGYKYLKDSKFESIVEEIEHVRTIYDYYRQGNLGFRSIAGLMPTNSRRGRDWKPHHIKEIITNPFYAGILTLNRRDAYSHLTVNKEITEWLRGTNSTIEPVLTLDKWKETWFIYKNRRDYYDDEKSTENARLRFAQFYVTNNVLNGLIFCKNCVKNLKCKDMRTTSKKGKEYGDIYYICKECEYKVSATKLHCLIEPIWKDIQKRVDVSEVTEVLYARFQNELNGVQFRADIYEKNIQEYSNNKAHYEVWIEEYGREKNEEKDIYEVFSLANSHNEKNLTSSKRQYSRYKFKLDYLSSDKEKVLREHERLVNIIKENYKSIPTHDLKKLLHFAISHLTIDPSGKVEYGIKSELL